MMKEFFLSSKQTISTFLTSYLETKRTDLKHINRWSDEVIDNLLSCATKGKMVRGSLVLFGAGIKGEKITDDALKAATAIELFHTALLIHDDIMDEDLLRRGEKTTHAQYQDFGIKNNLSDPTHFGHSMAICVGDIAFFLGFELLATLANQKIMSEIIHTYTSELSAVGIAQMQDVYFGSHQESVTKEEVIEMYRYKTARYTFSLPLKIGAILGSLDTQTTQQLEQFGELLGIIFQIKDDEMGIFGQEKTIGKPVGSDIREGKKTLYYLALEKQASPIERERLTKIFGNKDVSSEDLNFVYELMDTYNVRNEVEKNIISYTEEAKNALQKITLSDKYLSILNELVDYNLERTK
jgi:geranylgeranyl diphosphate synthase type I